MDAVTEPTEPSEPTVVQRIVRALAATYQRQGFHQVAVPAAALMGIAGTREVLEEALAELLDESGVVPVGTNGVALHPSARVALLTRGVIGQWLSRAARETGPLNAVYRDGIAVELSTLVAWALNVAPPDDLTQRAAELAGVLATVELDPRAMEVVATHGGTPHSRLAALAAVKPRSLPLDRLRDHLRHTVSSAYPAG
jgi:hypothetical protein